MTELTHKSEKAMERTDKFIKKVQPYFFIFLWVFFVHLTCAFLNIKPPIWFILIHLVLWVVLLVMGAILLSLVGYEFWLAYRLDKELKLITEDAYENALIRFYRMENIKQNISENPNADLLDLMWFAGLRCHYWKTDRKEKHIEKIYNNFGEQFSIKVNIEFIDKSGEENDKR